MFSLTFASVHGPFGSASCFLKPECNKRMKVREIPTEICTLSMCGSALETANIAYLREFFSHSCLYTHYTSFDALYAFRQVQFDIFRFVTRIKSRTGARFPFVSVNWIIQGISFHFIYCQKIETQNGTFTNRCTISADVGHTFAYGSHSSRNHSSSQLAAGIQTRALAQPSLLFPLFFFFFISHETWMNHPTLRSTSFWSTTFWKQRANKWID